MFKILTYEDVYKEGYLPHDIEWKPLKGEEDKFLISNYGHIKRLYRQIIDSKGRRHTYPEKIFYPKLIKKKGHDNNYYTRVSYGIKREFAHRLVAKNFLENSNNLPEVNHIDGNKKFLSYAGTKEFNYKNGNLEWCDRKGNMLHASKTGLLNKTSEKRKEACRRNQKLSIECSKKKVYMYDENYSYLAEFESVKTAGFLLNIPASTISRSCRIEGYTAGGFYWSYDKR